MRVVELGRWEGRRDRALVFETGDRVLPTLEAFARDASVRAARFTALGAFRTATLAFFDWETRAYRAIPVEEQVEVTSMVGNIGVGPDGVVVHAHCVLGRPDGSAVTGHLRAAEVRPTLELFLTSYDTTLGRVQDDDSGLALVRGGEEVLQ